MNDAARLRDRISELEEENRQLREVAFGKPIESRGDLSPCEHIILKTIARAPHVQGARLAEVVGMFMGTVPEYPEQNINVLVSKARKKLAKIGVAIKSRPRNGYWLEKPDADRLREAGVL